MYETLEACTKSFALRKLVVSLGGVNSANTPPHTGQPSALFRDSSRGSSPSSPSFRVPYMKSFGTWMPRQQRTEPHH